MTMDSVLRSNAKLGHLGNSFRLDAPQETFLDHVPTKDLYCNQLKTAISLSVGVGEHL